MKVYVCIEFNCGEIDNLYVYVNENDIWLKLEKMFKENYNHIDYKRTKENSENSVVYELISLNDDCQYECLYTYEKEIDATPNIGETNLPYL